MALVTDDDLPDEFWWWPYYRLAKDMRMDPEVVMGWPIWKLNMMSAGDHAMAEWERAYAQLHHK